MNARVPRRSLSIVSPPQVEPHRWKPPSSRPGLAPLDEDTRARLRAWRERTPPREPWRSRLALAMVLVLHGLFALVVWWEMQPRPVREVVHTQPGGALQVRLIALPRAPSRTPPAVPAPPSPPPRARPVHEPLRPAALTASLPAAAASTPSAPPRLYDRTGQPLLPARAATTATPEPGYIQRMPQGDTQVMQHDSPVRYRATRFEEYFPPPDETIAGQGVRRALRATHTGESKSVDLGHGIHLKCKTLLGIPTPDCTMPPAPPSRKDGDERLNMAPAPLAKELAPPARKLSACIALYRAGKPLPHGCPIDTPARAVDAECAEARQAGKPLPSHCRKP
ncbi:MAG TPA: hypothetical protein VFH59_04720 [Frateuria sp.]|uniref:hypothetical protein n=1 Tax=Frateuria sp. TaxID=2211372 RepID=UPI002D7F927F|nr:hypothetical protein [Frateuria sp.]HET6804729.1 hypothetical protein [Frateuria sp.]